VQVAETTDDPVINLAAQIIRAHNAVLGGFGGEAAAQEMMALLHRASEIAWSAPDTGIAEGFYEAMPTFEEGDDVYGTAFTYGVMTGFAVHTLMSGEEPVDATDQPRPKERRGKGFLSRRRKAYAAVFRVEGNRADAQALRTENPDMYQRIVEQAGDEAEGLAQRDPDAWVALFLASAKDEMQSAPAVEEQGDRFGEYLELFGGPDGARYLITDHLARHHGIDVDEGQADALLEGFRHVGIPRDLSLGKYLDEIAAEQAAIPHEGPAE
jgi:hypothetical protein